jgi:copper transport protein
MRTTARRLLLAGTMVLAVLALGTGVASAHASIVATSPADGTSVTPSPPTVTATFTERVSIGVGGLTVRNANGLRVDSGPSKVDSAGTTVTVGLQTALPDGTYVATYRVLSVDGHPISASFLFGVGSGPIDTNAASLSGTGGNRAWEITGTVARFLMYLSALLAAGLVFFLAFIHDRDEDRWRLIGFARVATITALFGAAGIIVVQAALLSGKGLSAITDGGVLGDVLNSRLGWSLAALTMGLIAVHLSTDISNLIASQALALYGGLATAASFAIWGHSTELAPIWLSTVADVIHVSAAAVWFGGIVGLVMVLRRPIDQPVASTARVVGRFSTTAALSVGFLAAAGIALSWNASGGSWSALVSTTYGRLLLVKVVITGGILAIAGYNRSWLVPALVHGEANAVTATGSDATSTTDASGKDAPAWRRLRRTVAFEAIALVAVMGITSVLVNVTPARTAFEAADRVVDQTQSVATGSVNLIVLPARVGENTLHIRYTDASGKPIDVSNTLNIEFSLPSADLAAISRQTAKAGPGHFIYTGPELSILGTWTVTLVARTSDFSEQRTTFQVPIRN